MVKQPRRSRVKTEPDDPGIADPADRTRLAWTRTAIAFAAIGAAMLKLEPGRRR